MENPFIQKNLNSFKSRYSRDAEQIQRAFELYRPERFSHSDSKYFDDGKVFDSSDPELLKMSIPSDRPIRLAVLLGFGVGCAYDAFSSQRPQTVDGVVLVEPDWGIFVHALHLRDWTEVIEDKKVQFIVGKDYDGCFAEFYNFLAPLSRAARMNTDFVYTSPLQERMFRDYYFEVRDEWQAAKNLVRLDYGNRRDSLVGIKHVFENFPLIESLPGVAGLEGKFRGRPAIVVATGPSLLRSLPLLKKLQNRALIISADASYKILIENGITPHLVTSIERDEISFKFFAQDESAEKARTHLVGYPLVPRKVWDTFTGPKWIAFRDYGYFHLLNNSFKKGIVSSSSSVAHFSVRLAAFLGCDPIVLIGQDLAVNQETYATHPEGVAYDEWSRPRTFDELEQDVERLNLGKILWVPGNKDTLVATTTVYYCFLKQFSWEAIRLPNRIINATDGGARIPNLEYRDLASFDREWITNFDAFKILDEAHRAPSTTPRVDLNPLQHYLTEMNRKLVELTEISTSFKQEEDSDRIKAVVRTLESAREGLQRDSRFLLFVLSSIGGELLETEMEWYETSGESLEIYRHQIDILCRWFRLAQETVAELSEVVKNAARDQAWGAASEKIASVSNPLI